MSTNYNPQIVTDGLALYLDAGNSKNYNLTAVEVLVVAGGGGGGGGHGGGGGGAGGLIYNSNFTVTPGSALTVTVGGGGAGGSSGTPGSDGSNSVFGSLTATGGGGGGGENSPFNGRGGGSGGGGSGYAIATSGGSGTSNQGNSGGGGGTPNTLGNATYGHGGGGGGAGASGTDGTEAVQPDGNVGTAGVGGSGLGFNISGTFTYYAGGGGGGYWGTNLNGGAGGLGGGGRGGDGGSQGQNGTANTGGGGGGSPGIFVGGARIGGNGGSGIVIVRYPGPQKAIGGTVTSVGGHTIHTFTTVESTTFTPLVATNNSAILGLSDFSGNNNFGTTVNSPTYSSSNGGSIVFDGTDDNISILYNASLKPTTAITMEAFCYIQNNGTTWASLIQYPQNSSSHIDPYFDWAIYLNMSSRVLHTRIDGEGASSPNNVWNFNQWTYVAITFENQSVKYYVNGASVGSSSVTKTSITYDANNPVFIGKNASGTEPFEGNLGNIKVYNRALTAAEIQQNYNALKGRYVIDIVKGGLVLNLDAGSSYGYSGTTWRDLSGVIGDVNVQNRSTDWSFQTDSSSGQVCLYNDSDRISNPGIDIPVNNGFNKLEGTIDLWLKPTSHTGGIGWFNNSDGNSYTNSSNWFWIGTWATSYVLYFRQGNESTCCNDLTISSFTSSYPLNTWQHWCVTWKVSTGFAAIYKNGTLQTSTTGLPTNIPNTNPTNTGQLFNGHTRGDNMQFRGYCNAYKIYNRALSAEEVLQNFNALRGRFGI